MCVQSCILATLPKQRIASNEEQVSGRQVDGGHEPLDSNQLLWYEIGHKPLATRKGVPRMKRIIIVAVCGLAAFGCSKNPRDVRITPQNKDTFMDEIKNMKGLTVDEARLLILFQIGQGMSSAFGAKSQDPTGKTVGQLLADLKKREAAAKAEADQQNRLAAEAKARADALAAEAKAKADALMAELRKSINLTVYDKGFRAGSLGDDKLTFRCVYQNLSSKDIRAFWGGIKFTDLFGAEIHHPCYSHRSNCRGQEGNMGWRGEIQPIP